MAKGLLIIRTLTPTHPGAGTSVGAIDLMLQREVTTEFPFIQGSSLKGAIRSYLKDEQKDVLNKVFGPREVEGSDFRKGSLIISDASLLFYPVRTLKGLYALVTCPEILKRLNMPHVNLQISDNLLDLSDKSKVKTLNSTRSKYAINNRVYFEDLNFTVETVGDGDFNWVSNKLGLPDDIKSRLFLVHDDIFQYFVKFATQIVSRNKINYKTGTVDKQIGGIWTEEHLPPETHLFSYLEDDEKVIDESNNALKWLEPKVNSKVIHLGGDETVGKGFVGLKVKELNGGD
ncbi:MAG: type III-B CRISPR module RAMP protein Cmr4 [Desulfonauticus sp.]|nr:type III-B CRISPR module RAMP protein Cmr4 [Desulfonauticus sp.]